MTIRDNIHHGTSEQERAVEDLKQIMGRLTQELNDSVMVSVNVMTETESTADKILQTQSQMELLKDLMGKISEMSMALGRVI